MKYRFNKKVTKWVIVNIAADPVRIRKALLLCYFIIILYII